MPIVLIGGPIALLLGLGWSAWRNRSITAADERRTDQGARKLRKELARDEERR